jgi:hypothetical protein
MAMVTLELTAEEHATLVEILDEFLSDLRMEIADTDAADFKDELRHEKGIVQQLVAKVKSATDRAPGGN